MERTQARKQDRITENLNDFRQGVLGVPGTPTVKLHEPELRSVLGLRCCMVYSELLQETIFFCEDEAIKASLLEAGANEWSIYTRAELQVLVKHHRAKPFIPDELLRLHQAKRTFNAKIGE